MTHKDICSHSGYKGGNETITDDNERFCAYVNIFGLKEITVE